MNIAASPSVRLFFADDHPIFLTGLCAFFDDADDIDVVGQATTPTQAARLLSQMRPDIAVMDVVLGGVSIIGDLLSETPGLQIICLTAHDDVTHVRHAIATGARGYVLKRSAGQNVRQAVDAVSRGGIYIDPAVADRVVGLGRTSLQRGDGARQRQNLTDRERDVLRLIALGFTIKEVAVKLGVTPKSIETYKARAADKLDIHSRAKIVQYAMLQGWFHSGASG
jgi:DNA-binding NarL/FixJ family response regulator